MTIEPEKLCWVIRDMNRSGEIQYIYSTKNGANEALAIIIAQTPVEYRKFVKRDMWVEKKIMNGFRGKRQ